jgi:citrate synthase
VTAGNTALCTVGRTGNDLHYRGYDIVEIATCAFEEIAYPLIHEKLPTRAELNAYKRRLKSLRALPAPLKRVLEEPPATSHPMDVLRTGTSTLGCLEPEKGSRAPAPTSTLASSAPSARCAGRSTAAPTRWPSRSRSATRTAKSSAGLSQRCASVRDGSRIRISSPSRQARTHRVTRFD